MSEKNESMIDEKREMLDHVVKRINDMSAERES